MVYVILMREMLIGLVHVYATYSQIQSKKNPEQTTKFQLVLWMLLHSMSFHILP